MTPPLFQPFENVQYPCYWLDEKTGEFCQNEAAEKAALFGGNSSIIRRYMQEASQLRVAPLHPQFFPLADGNNVYTLTILPADGGIFASATPEVLPPVSALGTQLREPLTNVFAVLPLLGKRMEDSDIGYLEEIQQNCYKVLRLVTNLESLQSLSKKTPRQDIIDYSSFIDSIASSASTLCKGTGIPIKASLPNTPVFVKGDKQLLSQTIFNVLRNSLQYTRDENKISIRLRSSPTHAILTIEDLGIGIHPNHIEKVFEPYFSSDPYGDSDTPQPGLGLGLAISKQAMQSFGGSISIESTFSEGTRVTLALPLHQAQDDTVAKVLDSDATDYLLNRYSAIYVQLYGYCRAPDL